MEQSMDAETSLPGSDRAGVLAYAAWRYGTRPEHLWQGLPGYAVLRHTENGKWYGVIMDVPRTKLGLPGPGRVDVLEVKADPVSGGSVQGMPGILPAYHMARGSWLSVLLDGSVPPVLVFSLLDGSFAATAPARRRTDPRDREVWLLPSNPHYFNLEAAFARSPTVRWQQRVKAAAGDMVYLYVTAPVCAVLYRCQVTRADIPWDYDDGRIHARRGMDLKLLTTYSPDVLPREKLQTYGVRAVRGPRHMPHRLACLLEETGGKP